MALELVIRVFGTGIINFNKAKLIRLKFKIYIFLLATEREVLPLSVLVLN